MPSIEHDAPRPSDDPPEPELTECQYVESIMEDCGLTPDDSIRDLLDALENEDDEEEETGDIP